MCSRFELNRPAREVAARFGLAVPPVLANRAEVRPTDQALVIGPNGARLMPWGLAVEWDKRPLINARAETLAERPTFRRLLGARLLVPASAWWEWRDDGAKRKTRMRLEPAGGGLFALAALTDGNRFAIVTRAACPSVAHVHDRMPAVVPPEEAAAWLSGQGVPDFLRRPHRGEVTARPDADAPPVPAQKGLFD